MNDQTEAPKGKAVEVWEATRLPWHPALDERLETLGLSRRDWKTICEVIFPSATEVNSIIMALEYARSRKLDVMKKMIHIVPVYDSKARATVDTIWPSIAELRVTATRSGEYAGADRMEFGPMVEKTFKGKLTKWVDKRKTESDEEITMKFPEWAQVTLYKIVKGQRVAFNPPAVYWEETYGIQGKFGQSDLPNSMWKRRARGQLAKCCEAAALRFTFPEEIGNDITAEEMEGQQFYGADNAKNITPQTDAPAAPPPTAAAEPPAEKAPEPEPIEEPEQEVLEPEPETENELPDDPVEPASEETPVSTTTWQEMFEELSEKILSFTDPKDMHKWLEIVGPKFDWVTDQDKKSGEELDAMVVDKMNLLKDNE